MPADYYLSPTAPLRLAELGQLLARPASVRLSDEAKTLMQASQDDGAARPAGEPGPAGSFGGGAGPEPGALPTGPAPISQLLAHAGGGGAEVPPELVRLMLLLKAQSLSHGRSGLPLAVVQRLLDMHNREMYPVVYEQGAGGAFGDSAALAHLGLPLRGLGEVNYQGYRLATADALSLFSWAPLPLTPPQELAWLSGTAFTLAYAVEATWRAERLARAADVIAALSGEAFGGPTTAFEERLIGLRPHAGAQVVARRLRELLAGPEPPAQLPTARAEAQPYSFRCVPQVHGASRDALAYVRQIMDVECASTTESPAVFPEDDVVLSGGNFHGQPLALALDHLARAVAGLAGISERRTQHLARLGTGQPEPAGAPAIEVTAGRLTLAATAASLVRQSQLLSSTAGAASSRGFGAADHLSGSAEAAPLVRRVVESAEQVLAIELLLAARASRRPGRRAGALETVRAALARDGLLEERPARTPQQDLQAATGFVRRFEWE